MPAAKRKKIGRRRRRRTGKAKCKVLKVFCQIVLSLDEISFKLSDFVRNAQNTVGELQTELRRLPSSPKMRVHVMFPDAGLQ
jgi:hypothetical protein